eukprot:g81048.t1
MLRTRHHSASVLQFLNGHFRLQTLSSQASSLSAARLQQSRSFSTDTRKFSSEAAAVEPSVTDISDTVYQGNNATYIEMMREQWERDPKSVHSSWNVFFLTGRFQSPPSQVLSGYQVQPNMLRAMQALQTPRPMGGYEMDMSALDGDASLFSEAAGLNMAVQPEIASVYSRFFKLYRSFQVLGYKYATLDPLGLRMPRKFEDDKVKGLLDLNTYGISENQLDQYIDLTTTVSPIQGLLHASKGRINLRHVYNRLKEIYTDTIGYEYMHIPDSRRCNWLRNQIETMHKTVRPREERVKILENLMWSHLMEKFLHTRFATHKRFGLEGTESFIPGMKGLIHKAAELGCNNIVIGMPHRGRLNVLVNVIRKPMEEVLAEFSHNILEDPEAFGSGDVKYHLGFSLDRLAGPQHTPMHISLVANPSHLEAVNPVVLGKARAKQDYTNSEQAKREVLPLLLHGDAAFQGQGVIYECFGYSAMEKYTVGGTIHLVVNNQIGFTCDPPKRPYSTDIAKAVEAPIFHVNADDPEAVVRVMELATEYRMTFKSDVVVDLIGYRKFGHNEIDEPSFTQPLMYDVIRSHPDVLSIHSQRLIKQGVVTQQEVDTMMAKINNVFEQKFEIAKKKVARAQHWMENQWSGLVGPNEVAEAQNTGVDPELLKQIGIHAVSVPKGFNVHKRLKGVLQKRKECLEQGKDLQWADGEALAFGSLLLEGYPVRISGQDVERGTFSHRHATLHDQKTGKRYTPLANLSKDMNDHARPSRANKSRTSSVPPKFTASNSHLSEYGVLGFELGYSLESPNALVIWEAQFGDFANTAQVIIDQFISAGEDKWLRQNGLVVLLPHGYEGMGPEHSSARFERFLAMTKEEPHVFPTNIELDSQIQMANWQVVNCTTPANYFHVLRRQLFRKFRKPLIMMSPKSLLRHPMATSELADFAPGTQFQWLIPEHDQEITQKASQLKRVVFCTGKVYYDILQKRQEEKNTEVSLIRLEQLSPFPWAQVEAELNKYPKAQIVWAQEEPMNMGAWTHVEPRLRTVAKRVRGGLVEIEYVGRRTAASTATGYSERHKQ